MSRGRSGFVLIWIVVVFGVIAALSAAAAPTLVTIIDRARVEQTYAMLAQVDSGIVRFGTQVRRVGLTYPGQVSQLSTIVVGNVDQNGCGQNMTPGNSVGDWTSFGPFIPFYADPSGLDTPIGVLNDAIEHPAAGSPIIIRIPNADGSLVTMMDELVDGTVSGTAGKILYVAPNASGETDLQYRVGTPPTFALRNQC